MVALPVPRLTRYSAGRVAGAPVVVVVVATAAVCRFANAELPAAEMSRPATAVTSPMPSGPTVFSVPVLAGFCVARTSCVVSMSYSSVVVGVALTLLV